MDMEFTLTRHNSGMKDGIHITKNKGRGNYSITTIQSHTKESLKMECPMEKGLQPTRMELSSKLNGLMGLMLGFFDTIFVLFSIHLLSLFNCILSLLNQIDLSVENVLLKTVFKKNKYQKYSAIKISLIGFFMIVYAVALSLKLQFIYCN